MSSVAVFSFGAFGDFVTLIELGVKVIKHLSASSGPSEDYQALILDIDSLVRILKIATIATTSIRHSQLPASLVQTGCNALQSAQDNLKRLEAKIETYQQRLRKGGSYRKMMESWAKIGWGLLVKDEDVITLRWQLSYNVRTIQVVMSSAQCARTDEVGQQTQLMLDRLTGRLPQCIGYTWEGGMSVESAPIQLRDMYNNVLSIPLDLCATPELFDNVLRMYFKGRKGNRFIVKGDYELTTAGSSSLLHLIEPAQWKTVVKPGVEVEMKAIIRRQSRPDDRTDSECPRCRRIVHDVRVDTSTPCPYCPCVFTIARTNIDDPINSLDVDGSLDPDCIYGPTEWRIQHSQELEETYAESQALCHVRLLDWLQVRYARQVPKFQKGIRRLTYRDPGSTQEVPVLWEGTRTLSNGVVMHDVFCQDTGELLSLPPSALVHNIPVLEIDMDR